METSTYFHRFNLGKRGITLALIIQDKYDLVSHKFITIGMATRMPTDKDKPDIGDIIAQGRALSKNSLCAGRIYGVLVGANAMRGILKDFERKIRQDPGKYIACLKTKK